MTPLSYSIDHPKRCFMVHVMVFSEMLESATRRFRRVSNEDEATTPMPIPTQKSQGPAKSRRNAITNCYKSIDERERNILLRRSTHSTFGSTNRQAYEHKKNASSVEFRYDHSSIFLHIREYSGKALSYQSDALDSMPEIFESFADDSRVPNCSFPTRAVYSWRMDFQAGRGLDGFATYRLNASLKLTGIDSFKSAWPIRWHSKKINSLGSRSRDWCRKDVSTILRS